MLLKLWIVNTLQFVLGCCFVPVPPSYCLRWVLALLRMTFSLPLTSPLQLFLELSFWPSSRPPSLHPLRSAFMCILWNINVFLGLPSFLVSLWDMEGFSCGNKSACVWESTTALFVYVRCVLVSQYVRGRRKANWPTINYNICSHNSHFQVLDISETVSVHTD